MHHMDSKPCIIEIWIIIDEFKTFTCVKKDHSLDIYIYITILGEVQVSCVYYELAHNTNLTVCSKLFAIGTSTMCCFIWYG
jgi:hypothetical protein